MKTLLFLGLYVVNNAIAQVPVSSPQVPKPAEVKAEPIALPKINTISSLKLISLDQQIFILHEDETSWGIVPAISFARGERIQRTFPAPVKSWEIWRTRFHQLMTRLPKAKKCPHPLTFQSERNGKEFREKEVCLDEIKISDRNQIQQLTREWNKFLYGE